MVARADADAADDVPLSVGWTAAIGAAAGLGCCAVLLLVALGYVCLLRGFVAKAELGASAAPLDEASTTRV